MTPTASARVSPVFAWHDADPLLSALLRMSGTGGDAAGAVPAREMALERLAANGIAFVILNRRAAAPPLVEYVEQVLRLSVVEHEDGRSLYVVTP